MQIRTADVGDHPGIASVLDTAFGQPDETRIVEALRADDADSLELVADHHGTIIGTVMFSPASAHLGNGEVLRGLGLGPVAVTPDQQGKGIGSALIEAGLEHFEPYPVAFFCVLGEPDYYARFGFTPAIERGWTWEADDGSIPEMRSAFQIRLPRPLPAGRAVLRYHPAFGG
jgi:putative acetyltransferase